ncbi:hypothetical protein SLEP1_g38045 [Rubroshorea leprosula]|uniref:Uncharacterized protein n=1 Tax=Rubroshorea leprosula TaxID=152421 RepID=A0AAV5KWL5_9ROSI|nr:hypothetical protein SLEP1_g38045 [Rubroshorea leprosula]
MNSCLYLKSIRTHFILHAGGHIALSSASCIVPFCFLTISSIRSAIGPVFVSEIVSMDENAADEIMREVDIDAAGEIVEEEEEIELVNIELEEEEI